MKMRRFSGRAKPLATKRKETEQQRLWREQHVNALLHRRYQSIVMTWRCVTCAGEWTLEGSYAAGACTRCGT